MVKPILLLTVQQVTYSLTDYCLDFIDVTLACEDANSILVEAVTVADEHRIGNSLLQI